MDRKHVLFPLPDNDFDTTECAVAYDICTESGLKVVFATENGDVAACDEKLLTGVLCGQLGAEADAIECYQRMLRAPAFNAPIKWEEIVPADYDGLWLSGGHAPGMRQYLGSRKLHEKVQEFWKLRRPVAAICHGPIVLARSIDNETGRSVLYGYRTMSLPYWMEKNAYMVTCCCLGKYYRTYDAYVEDEVRSVLENPATDYVKGPRAYLGAPKRGTRHDDRHARICVDRHYASGRWPGDTYALAREFVRMVQQQQM